MRLMTTGDSPLRVSMTWNDSRDRKVPRTMTGDRQTKDSSDGVEGGALRPSWVSVRRRRMESAQRGMALLRRRGAWDVSGREARAAHAYGRASRTRLNGVWVARRKRVKPPAVTTSLSLDSP